jgi:hypothetical protein
LVNFKEKIFRSIVTIPHLCAWRAQKETTSWFALDPYAGYRCRMAMPCAHIRLTRSWPYPTSDLEFNFQHAYFTGFRESIILR